MKMKKLILLLTLVATAQPASATELYAKVVSVYDGDTITINHCGLKDKVRLIGVDTPEMRQGDPARMVRDYVRKLILNKTVIIVTGKRERGPYGRLLSYVYIDGVNLNKKLIEEGYAVPLFYKPNTEYQLEFENLAAIAKAEGRGLWSAGVFDQTPKEFRDAQDDI
jgi:micrococcal nuclease